MKARLTGTAITLIWVCALLVLWSIGTAYSLPSLGELPGAWLGLVRNEGLLYELGVSLKLNAEAIVLSTLLSVGIAYAAIDRLARPPAAFLSAARFFGVAGFVVIFTRIFGGGHALKVALLVFSMSTFFLTSMLDVVDSATREEFDHTRSLRMGKWRGIYEVVILGKLDQTFDVLRQNAAIGWVMLTMVEGLVRFEGGLGVVMLTESKYRNLAAVISVVVMIGIIGALQDLFLQWLKGVCCPHSRLVLEKK